MRVIRSLINSDVSASRKHKHAEWELVYRISGETDTAINDKVYRINKGDLYLIPPEIYHYDLSDGLFTDLVIQVDFLNFSEVLVLSDTEDITFSLSKMINDLVSRREENYQSIADSLMDALAQYLKRFTLMGKQNSQVKILKDIIFENIENPDFDISEVIKNMSYNADYIRRCFKSYTKITPLEYLTELRIARAKQLLIMPTFESIEAVSLKCGFRDPLYFSTCFKKHTGLSPTAYKKQNPL